MVKAVSNATVLIFLSKLNRLDLLWNKYGEILIPAHVKEEILAKNEQGLKDALAKFNVRQPKNKRELNIGQGETEAILLCKEEKITDFLSDDKRARSTARMLNLNTIGTIGILLWNLDHKRISNKQFAELFDELIKKKYYISTELYLQIKNITE